MKIKSRTLNEEVIVRGAKSGKNIVVAYKDVIDLKAINKITTSFEQVLSNGERIAVIAKATIVNEKGLLRSESAIADLNLATIDPNSFSGKFEAEHPFIAAGNVAEARAIIKLIDFETDGNVYADNEYDVGQAIHQTLYKEEVENCYEESSSQIKEVVEPAPEFEAAQTFTSETESEVKINDAEKLDESIKAADALLNKANTNVVSEEDEFNQLSGTMITVGFLKDKKTFGEVAESNIKYLMNCSNIEEAARAKRFWELKTKLGK